MILGLAATLPSALFHGLTAQGVSPAVATRVSHLPPVGSLFAAFLGYNPMQHAARPGHALAPAPRHGGLPDQPLVLPAPHLARLLRRADRGLRLRRGGLHPGRLRLAAPRRQVPLRRAGHGHPGEHRATPRTSMTGCRPRRRWPRPSRCWWTEMAREHRHATNDAADDADRRADTRRRHPHQRRRHPGRASRRARCATTRSSGCSRPSLYTAGGERRYTLDDLAAPRAHPGAARGPRHEPRRDPRVPRSRDPAR